MQLRIFQTLGSPKKSVAIVRNKKEQQKDHVLKGYLKLARQSMSNVS